MASYTRSKICGLTSRGDALAAAESGADAIGLVFFATSSRCVSVATAREIAAAVGPFVTVVGLFVDAEPRYVREVLRAVPIQLLQFHGAETPEYCEAFERPYIKALKVKPVVDSQSEQALEDSRRHVLEQARRYGSARGILLDTLSAKGQGGTGESFNWQCVPNVDTINWILAGGLHPGNVRKAVRMVQPYAVDVSSGVELSPGVKDPGKVRLFVEGVKTANQLNCGK